jgi:DNA-binding Lrp family transcriptional regulator
MTTPNDAPIDATDRRIIAATQGGLPLTPAPYAEVAGWLGLSEAEVIARMAQMQAAGVIRRIALAPNHYALGLVANGMSVWDVDDAQAVALGTRVGALGFVSHCYLRPRAAGWPYNLFAMIHGRGRPEVESLRAQIAALLGDACRGQDILYSTRILKKTGMRLTEGGQ